MSFTRIVFVTMYEPIGIYRILSWILAMAIAKVRANVSSVTPSPKCQ